MKLRWSLEAANDLEDISDYLHLNRPEFALTTINRIYDGVQTLRAFPLLGRPSRYREGCRDLLFLPLPYLCVYGIDEHAVYLLQIRHMAQDHEEPFEVQ